MANEFAPSHEELLLWAATSSNWCGYASETYRAHVEAKKSSIVEESILTDKLY